MREDGSLALQCNQFDGRCPCKRGRGGRTWYVFQTLSFVYFFSVLSGHGT